MEKFFSNWRGFLLNEERVNKLKESREKYLAEISSHEANQIMNWFGADYGKLSFDDIFDGKLRIAFSIRSEDQQNLGEITEALGDEGWRMPEDPDDASWRKRRFKTKMVKQKLRRLGTGEEYYVEKEVADLELNRSRPYEIPKGPRAGEIINKVETTSMSKAINRSKNISAELKEWWQNKQIYFTNDKQWRMVEEAFKSSGEVEPMMIVLSRHPLDVLRMSDISNISSCHSEGHSHFQCAQAEAKGHGPIAYLIKQSEYEDLMNGMYSDLNQSYDKIEPEWQRKAKAEAAKWLQDVILNGTIPRSSNLFKVLSQEIDDPAAFEFALDAIYDAPHLKYNDLSVAAKGVLGDQVVVDAIKAKMESDDAASEWLYNFVGPEPEEQEKPRHGDISELDDQEIFRDRDRGKKGIGIESRVRLRRFEGRMSANKWDEFAAPERRVYGRGVPGFLQAVTKWAFEQQKEKFAKDEEGVTIPPDFSSITRYGGSYEDTRDGEVLNFFFEQDPGVKDPYNWQSNVDHDTQDEEDNQFEEYENRVEELNNYAANTLEHISAHAMVDGDEQPYVGADASMEIEIQLNGWESFIDRGDGRALPARFDEEANEFVEIEEFDWIPTSWNDQYLRRFIEEIEPNLDVYIEEASVEVDSYNHNQGVYITLQLRLAAEDINNPDDYEGYIDYLKSDVDDKYESIVEQVRKNLVEGEYMAKAPFDAVPETETWENWVNSLENWDLYEADDEPNKIYFDYNGPGNQHYISTTARMPNPNEITQGATRLTSTMISSVIGGNPNRSSHTTVNHTGQASKAIAAEFNELNRQAQEYAARQLQLDFGEKYADNEKKKEQIDSLMASRAKFSTHLVDAHHAKQAGLPPEAADANLGLSMQIVFQSDMTGEAWDAAVKYIHFLDDKIPEIRKIATKMYQEAIDEWKAKSKAAKASLINKENVMAMVSKLAVYANQFRWDNPDDDPRYNPRAHAAKAFSGWVVQVWDSMSPTEQRVAVLRYLQPLDNGSLTRITPNDESGAPPFWNDYVRQELVAIGATGQVARSYRWQGDSYKDVWLEHAGNPTEEGLEHFNNQLSRGPIHYDLTGTLGEPRPAQESLKKSLTSQDVRGMIREVLRSRGILNEGSH
ncbi:MAG: hypothetical protein CMQ51_07080 [Gammaproteobacteria bacterium]|nr:hypothetical protein [Gammaproteobacteria bacterium]